MALILALLLSFSAGVGAALTVVHYLNKGSRGESSPRMRSRGPQSSITSSYANSSSYQRTGSFLTDLLASLWKQFNVAVSEEIKRAVQPLFKEMLPGPLKSLRFKKISLGDVPLKLDNCVVHESQRNQNNQEYVQIEVDCIWDGACDIQLQADYLGTFGVKSLKLAGRVSILFCPLVNALPITGAVQYGFINPPELSLEMTGRATVADFQKVRATIQNLIVDIISNLMVLPNRMMVPLVETISYFDVYQPALGVVRLTLVQGRGFQIEERHQLRSPDIPDVYCNIKVGIEQVWKTSVVKDNCNPVWHNQTKDFLLFDHDQIVYIDAWDEDKGPLDADDYLGSAQVTVGDILLSTFYEVELLTDGKPNGAYLTLHCDLLPTTSSLESLSSRERNDNLLSGLITILISQVYDVPREKDDDGKPILYFAKIEVGKHKFFTPVADASDPVFNCSFRVPLTSSAASKAASSQPVMFTLMEGEEASDAKGAKSRRVGSFTVPYNEVTRCPGNPVSARRTVCNGGPSLGYSISICGVQPPDPSRSINAGRRDGYSPVSAIDDSPRGGGDQAKVKITISKGWGFQIEKRRFKKDDIPDVYCMVKFGSNPAVWKTTAIKDNLAPQWNECRTFVMKDHGQVLNVHAFDEDGGANDPDDDLGSARISVGKLLLAGGSFDLELQMGGAPTGAFVSVTCELLSPEPKDLFPSTSNTDSAEIFSSEKVEDAAKPKTLQKRKVPTKEKPRNDLWVKVESGRGFQIEKRRFAKDDIPDVYCKVKIGHSKVWRTSTIKDNLSPEWHESKVFRDIDDNDVLDLEAWDEDKGINDPDDFLGAATVPVHTLLSASGDGFVVKLMEKGKANGCSVTLRCRREH